MNKKLVNMVAMKDEELDAVVGGLEAVDATYHTFKYNVGDSIQVYQIRHKMFNWSIFDVTYTTTVIDRRLGDDGLEYYQVSDAKTWYAEDNIGHTAAMRGHAAGLMTVNGMMDHHIIKQKAPATNE